MFDQILISAKLWLMFPIKITIKTFSQTQTLNEKYWIFRESLCIYRSLCVPPKIKFLTISLMINKKTFHEIQERGHTGNLMDKRLKMIKSLFLGLSQSSMNICLCISLILPRKYTASPIIWLKWFPYKKQEI